MTEQNRKIDPKISMSLVKALISNELTADQIAYLTPGELASFMEPAPEFNISEEDRRSIEQGYLDRARQKGLIS